MNFWIVVFIIALLMIGADKTLTYLNVKAVAKNNPDVEATKIEKNVVAKFMFDKLGMFWGSIIFGILTIPTFILAVWLFTYPASLWAPDNARGVALYIVMMVYGLVLTNNTYFFLRFNHII